MTGYISDRTLLIACAIILAIHLYANISGSMARLAGMAARFTREIVPGMRMIIDAARNGGLIDEAEAQRRRSELQEIAAVFGSTSGKGLIRLTFMGAFLGFLIGRAVGL